MIETFIRPIPFHSRSARALLLALVGAAGCAGASGDATDSKGSATSDLAASDPSHRITAKLGDHLPGISDADFQTARDEFTKVRGPDEGVGPIFNDRACGNCHALGAPGGAGDLDDTVTRFGRFAPDGTFDVLASEGGSLFHKSTLGAWTDKNGTACNVPAQVIPGDATVETLRLPPALFGLGLVDAMPDSFFSDLAQAEPESVRGIVNMVPILLPNPTDPTETVGGTRFGRLTWKGAVAGVTEFAAAAYKNEMGVTTQHCIAGQSVAAFSGELAPNGVPVSPVECQDNIPGTDFSVGSCESGRTEVEYHVAQFAKYITFLAPPPPNPGDDDGAIAEETGESGRAQFRLAGCANCHTDKTFVTPDHPFNGVPGDYAFRPYSDYLLHDMGSLGDRIGNQGDSLAKTRTIRTAPLWGIRFRTRLLHDGRAADIASAIVAHDGQGAQSAAAFRALSARKQSALVRFVSGL